MVYLQYLLTRKLKIIIILINLRFKDRRWPIFFYINKNVKNAAKIDWSSFPKKYGLIEILALEVILKTCKSTEKPPNPKIREAKTNLKFKDSAGKVVIKDKPLVISIAPIKNPKLMFSGIPSKLKSCDERICKKPLVFSIEIIIENKTTNPPINKTVLIEFTILLDSNSPKL